MIYPRHFEQKIGFDQVREMIRKSCINPMGQHYVDKIRFSSNQDVITKILRQVSEFKTILTMGESFPSQDYFDLREELACLKTIGTYIEQESLFDFKTSLRVIENILVYFNDTADEIEMSIYPNPTNGATNISVALNKTEDVTIRIFNASEQLVYSIADVNKPAGNHLFYWDGTNSGESVNAGYYFVKVTAGIKTTVKKLVLMK